MARRCGRPVQTGPAEIAAPAPRTMALAGRWIAPAGTSSRGDHVGTFRASDQLAAEELFHACYPRLAGWVRRLVDDDDTAHEIASEAFVRLLSRWTKVDRPQSYLYMIATNLIRDHWRKAERERRALRNVSAAAAFGEVVYPVQDVDVRNLI